MAMDKEMLLQRFQSQYLTRQEVLYKLPLNISINSFWPELIERRKMSSTVLPLHRADGKPVWYVLTDKMIAASEKLCAMALDNDNSLDPYRAAMTSAMTEELFFTSYVEGAQITLQEAMDFLSRGNEPENVQEQMIQNNLNAWNDMTRMLYYPLDERFVRMLAYRLTDEMEGHAADFRQEDHHPIAAMGSEGYTVPRAAALPELMKEYCAFLADPEVHPLIKAAVGQAYLLIARPFPEGNERLSRMISYAVLLRSGYDYLRDISVSGMIARESYRYFKSMRDVICSENGGDLTYFIEYYLDLLARAVDEKEKRDLLREQEKQMAERRLAAQPLERGDRSPQAAETADAGGPAARGNILSFLNETIPFPEEQEETEDDGENEEGEEIDLKPMESLPERLYTVDEYVQLLHTIHTGNVGQFTPRRLMRIFSGLEQMARNGPHSFRKCDWKQMTGETIGIAKVDVALMMKMGLIMERKERIGNAKKEYYLPLVQRSRFHGKETVAEEKGVQLAIQEMLQSEYTRERQMAEGLLDMLNNGKEQFTYGEWVARNPVSSKDTGFAVLRAAINYGFVVFENGVYRIEQSIKPGPKCFDMPDKQRDIVLKLMEAFPDEKFSVRHAAEFTGTKYSTMSYYLENFVQRGILRVEKAPGNINLYEFSSEVHGIFGTSEEGEESGKFCQLPAVKKEVHNPMRSMADAG